MATLHWYFDFISPFACLAWPRVRELMRRALGETSDDDLRAPTIRMWEGTPAEQMVSPAHVLGHILLHERGHHGDISTVFSQLGAEPPNVDYLVYRFFQSRKQQRDG